MADVTLKPMDVATFRMQRSGTDQRLERVRQAESVKGQDDDGLEAASRQFESLLLNMMIREMRATIPESGLFGTSMAEDIFTDMLDEQYGDLLARGGGIGLSRMIVEQMEVTGADDTASDRDQTGPTRLK